MISRRRTTNEVGSAFAFSGLFWKNFPGRRRVAPYNSSAALHLRAVRMLRRVSGNASTQWLAVVQALRDALSWQ